MTHIFPSTVLHWNYRGFTEFPLKEIKGGENEITDIYLKENLISHIPKDICRLEHLESLYLSGNDIVELPSEISKLRCLKSLDVSGNRLKCVPEEIGNLRSLKFLVLDDNEINVLPLRLGELRSLQYLSVCDNKLKWLPQRPVFNYHHCEFRFWRNPDLTTIPYSLWYHMLRDQQTRSLNIGCLQIPQYQQLLQFGHCRLKFQNESRSWQVDTIVPYQYSHIIERGVHTPPSLLELSKRTFYKLISDTAKNLSIDKFSIYASTSYLNDCEENNNEAGLDNLNFNNGTSKEYENRNKVFKCYRVPLDILEEYFDYLPRFLTNELSYGPVSKCENFKCKKPMFDFVTYEFCIGKMVLIDSTEDVILSAAFCSQSCANVWKGGKTNIIIPWTKIIEN